MGNFTDWLTSTGEGLANQATGGILGIALGGMAAKANDARQLAMQDKLQQMQEDRQKQMTDYSYQKQLDMWKATSYPGQMEQIEKAGLNPALLYGGGGGGGTTTGSAGATNITSGEAPKGGGEIMQGAQLGIQSMQLQLLEAQKRNIDADTANKEADTQNKPLQGQNIQASTASLTQGVENQKAQEQLTKAQTYIANLQGKFQEQTMNDMVKTVNWNMQQAENLVEASFRQNWINKATMEDKVKIVHQEAIGAVLRNANVSADTNNKIQQLQNDKIKWQELVQNIWMAKEANSRENAKLLIQRELARNQIGGDDGNVLSGLLDGIMNNITGK